MKPYELMINKDGELEKIKAVAVIAFEERSPTEVRLRMFDNPDIPESWWRLVIKQMYDGLDKAMEERSHRNDLKG
jgi:hypothetical protein